MLTPPQWRSIKAKLKSTFPSKRLTKVVPSLQEQATPDSLPKESVQVAPEPREEDTSTHSSAPADNTSLSGLSGLYKLGDNPAYGLDNHHEATPRRQRTRSNGSIESNAAVFGFSEGDSIQTVENQAQNPPVQAVPVQIMPDARVQPPSVNKMRGKAKPTISTQTFTPTHPNGSPNQSPGVALGLPPVTPGSRPMPLDPQNVQQKVPVYFADPLLSPSPAMVIPALGGSPPPKQITPSTPSMPPTPLKNHGKISEINDPVSNTFPDQPLLLHSPRPDLDSVSTAGEKRMPYGVIGDRRAAKVQFQPWVAEKLQDEPEGKAKWPPAKVEPTPVNEGASSARGRVNTSPIYARSKPIHVGRQKYYVGRYLGGGATGKVYSVVNKKSMRIYALKVIKRKDLKYDDFSMVKEELAIMRAISEAKHFGSQINGALLFVNHLVESWYDKDCIYFIMVCSAAGLVMDPTINV